LLIETKQAVVSVFLNKSAIGSRSPVGFEADNADGHYQTLDVSPAPYLTAGYQSVSDGAPTQSFDVAPAQYMTAGYQSVSDAVPNQSSDGAYQQLTPSWRDEEVPF
jgi:hypothetical protein